METAPVTMMDLLRDGRLRSTTPRPDVTGVDIEDAGDFAPRLVVERSPAVAHRGELGVDGRAVRSGADELVDGLGGDDSLGEPCGIDARVSRVCVPACSG